MAARIAIMAITTKSSIKVNPRADEATWLAREVFVVIGVVGCMARGAVQPELTLRFTEHDSLPGNDILLSSRWRWKGYLRFRDKFIEVPGDSTALKDIIVQR